MSDSFTRQCRGKVKLLSAEAAKRQAKVMHKLYKKKMMAYACPHCGYFHVGSNRSKEAARRREAR